MSRDSLSKIAMDTVMTLDIGNYVAPSGDMVAFEEMLDEARDGTLTFAPTDPIQLPTVKGTYPTKISVVNQGTLEAAKDLYDLGHSPAVLNFASAKNPGGGFMAGAQAQEECLARATGLYSCIVGNPMYAYHRRNPSPLYSPFVIFSPLVPVIKDSQGTYLEEPWKVGIITSPAPNAGVYRRSPEFPGDPEETVAKVYHRRVERVLAAASHMGVTSLVLGAWGCGVFGCDPDMAAESFRDHLQGKFRGVFSDVVFAILESGPIEILGETFRGHLLA